MKHHLTLLLLLAVKLSSYAQLGEFKSILSDIQSNLSEVPTGDEHYEQSLEWIEHSVLRYTSVKTDSKGRKSEEAFEFNVADLNEYLTREETKRDVIYVNIVVDDERKFIKSFEDGTPKSFVNSFTIIANDIDNARKLKDLFKKAIPVASKIMNNALALENYEQMKHWLSENVGAAELGNKKYEQKLEPTNEAGVFALTQTTITSKSTSTSTFYFNLADIDPATLDYTISGSTLSLDFKTRNDLKVINEYEEQVPVGFTNEIEIFTNRVENVKALKHVLAMAIPLAKEKVDASIKRYSSFQPAMNALTSLVKTIEYEDESVEQTIEGDCSIRYTGLEVTPKDKIRFFYELNFLDINEKTVEFGVSGDQMYVEFFTNETAKLIRHYERDDFKGYRDEVKILVENVEDARRMKTVVEDLATICKANYVDPFASMTLQQKIKWLESEFGEIMVGDKTISQEFSLLEVDNLKKMRLIKVTQDGKSTEEVYEFNFTDLNPKSIQYDIRGKSLSVVFETNQKEEIIKHYKDGEVENYQDSFELDLIDTEQARKVISVFNQIINALNQ